MTAAGMGGDLRLLAARLRAEGAPLSRSIRGGNTRARRAYQKAGFLGDRVVETGEGLAVLMLFKP